MRYDPPNDKIGTDAKQILQLGGTDGVADGFTTSFKLPEDITIHVVNGVVGPHYDPQQRTITLSYGFVNYTAGVLKTNFPELRRDDREFGKQLAAVDAFILVHEFGHAFIHAFDLPVLGREEDAADAVATVFLTRAVDNGAEYAFDAARFFNALSSPPAQPRAAGLLRRALARQAACVQHRLLDRGLQRAVLPRGRPARAAERGAPAALPGRVPAEGQRRREAAAAARTRLTGPQARQRKTRSDASRP